MRNMLTQRQLRVEHGDMKRRERDVRAMIANVRQWYDDGYNVSRELWDACKLRPEFLALPSKFLRFQALYTDAYAQHMPLGEDR